MPKGKKKIEKSANTRQPQDLNPKQKQFILEYLIDHNATQAAIRAGYSKHTAKEQGYRLLTNIHVQPAIEEAIKRQEVRTEITADRILKEIFRIASVDLRQAFDENGELKNIHDIPEDVARAISGIDVDELWEGSGRDRTQIGVTKKIRFNDKTRALELLGKYLKLFIEQKEITGANGGPIKVQNLDLSKLDIETLKKLAERPDAR